MDSKFSWTKLLSKVLFLQIRLEDFKYDDYFFLEFYSHPVDHKLRVKVQGQFQSDEIVFNYLTNVFTLKFGSQTLIRHNL